MTSATLEAQASERPSQASSVCLPYKVLRLVRYPTPSLPTAGGDPQASLGRHRPSGATTRVSGLGHGGDSSPGLVTGRLRLLEGERLASRAPPVPISSPSPGGRAAREPWPDCIAAVTTCRASTDRQEGPSRSVTMTASAEPSCPRGTTTAQPTSTSSDDVPPRPATESAHARLPTPSASTDYPYDAQRTRRRLTTAFLFVPHDRNDDVVALVEPATGSEAATYGYAPFGNTLVATEAAVTDTPPQDQHHVPGHRNRRSSSPPASSASTLWLRPRLTSLQRPAILRHFSL